MDLQAILDSTDSSDDEDVHIKGGDRRLNTLSYEAGVIIDRDNEDMDGSLTGSSAGESHRIGNEGAHGRVTTSAEFAASYSKAAESHHNGRSYRGTYTLSPKALSEASVGDVDLEQILREDDDDDDEDLIHGPSAFGRPPWHTSQHFSAENEVSIPTHASGASATSGSFLPGVNANGEDWDVLQAILGEDDDEDDAADSTMVSTIGTTSPSIGNRSGSRRMPTTDYNDSINLSGEWNNLSYPTSSLHGRSNVDAILQQSDDEDASLMDEDMGISSTSHWPSTRLMQLPHLPTQKTSGDIVPSKTDSFMTAAQSEPDSVSVDQQVIPIAPTSSSLGPAPTTARSSSSTDWDLGKTSQLALQYAENQEQKLLRSGHRDIVSPLMVKRRLKPKIELNTKQQQQQRLKEEEAMAGSALKSKFSKSINGRKDSRRYNNIQNTPVRFGFSGVVENKSMLRVSEEILKAVPDLPTALCINSRFIAVGTQRGSILVFDLFETLRQRLVNGGDTPFNVRTAGSVTTLDLSLIHGDILAAGYTSGYIVLWDTIKGVALRAVIESHSPSPITSVRFLADLKLVTVDAGGLVHKLAFSRNILWSSYSVESECLLDGTAGQILAMNVLEPYAAVHQQLPFATPAMKKIVLIALSSERSSFAVAVEPAVHVLHRWARPTAEQMARAATTEKVDTANGQQVYLPCLSWGWALVSGGGHVSTPILARAWGCSLQLLRASFQEEDTTMSQEFFPWPAFGVHDEFQTIAPMVALEWLSDRSLVYLTVNNQFTVIDTVMMTLLERLDFSGLRLVYAEFSLSRKAEGEDKSYCTTFQNSVRSYDNRLLLLCQEELKSVSIVGAKRRISGLEQDGEWLEALALALDHYENTISSQQDRKREPQGRRDFSKHPEYNAGLGKTEDEEWIAKLLIRYLNIAVENAPELNEDLPNELFESQLELAQSHFQMLAGVCVEFCVVTKRLDLLFGPIFRRFHGAGFVTVFLDILEPYILNDKLEYIAPEAMAHFVEHCRAINGIATVERCLLHMDVTVMDFDSILSLLRANEMYSALFYVYNQGLGDYTSPLEILAERIFDAADTTNNPLGIERHKDGSPQNDFEKYGYKAILYLQYCFEGRTFPQDTSIDDDGRKASIRAQLLKFLLQERFAPSAVRKPAKVVGQRAARFPYTHLFLMVDPKAMLGTMSLALNAPDTEFGHDTNFESIHGWEVEVGAERTPSGDEPGNRLPDRQEIMAMLERIIMPEESRTSEASQNLGLQSVHAVNAFLDFLAEYLRKGVVRANKDITLMILNRMASRFESATSAQDRVQSQKDILQLLTALPRNSYEAEEVLLLVKEAGVHRAALLLHQEGASQWVRSENEDEVARRASHFRAAIDCYLEDDELDFRREVFAYVKKECCGVSDESPDTDKKPDALRDALASKLSDLVQLDALLTAELVAELFVDDLEVVIQFLDDENSLYLFLQAIISGDLDEKDQVAGAVLNANLTMEHHHKYLELMAKLRPDEVYSYLQTHDNYRPEVCLPVCQKYEIADASTYLLERMGNVTSALQLILQTLESRMMGLKRTIRGMGTEFFSKYISPKYPTGPWRKRDNRPSELFDLTEREIAGVKRILIVALDLCERNSGTVSSRTEHGSQLWFNVLDRLINAKGFLRLSKEQPGHAKVMAGVLGELLRLTMHRMVSSVPLPDLVRKVTSDHSGSRLGELREMVESLLSTYGFEVNVFSGAVNVFQHDSTEMQRMHRALRVQGASVRKVMNIPLDGDADSAGKQFSASPARDGDLLQLGEVGNATLVASDGVFKTISSEAGEQGLGNALAKLRARRRSTSDNAPPAVKAHGTSLNFMTMHEKAYRQGNLSPDVTYFEDRISGVLGDAEHRGRLMSFLY